MNTPKAVKDHKSKGNYRPSRHAGRIENSVKLSDTPPKPPPHFDERHAKQWNDVCRQVYSMGVLTESDVHLIEVFVVNWFLWQDAVVELQTKGYTVTVEAGEVTKEVPNPAIRTMNDSAKLINQISDKLGFSPRARMGIKTQEQKLSDPLAGFIGIKTQEQKPSDPLAGFIGN